MRIIECGIECVDTIKTILAKAMGWYHAYFAVACLELGRCKALVAFIDDVEVGSILFYNVKLSPGDLTVIYYVVVEDGYRGSGIGKALVTSAEYISNSDMYIATTNRGNIASRKMFRDLGYSEIPLDHLNENTVDFVERVACSYEDDIALYKGVVELDYLASIPLNRVIANHLWRELCFNPWRRIRQML